MADYVPGNMDIKNQKQTYDIFWAWSIRVSVIVAVILIAMYLFLT